MSNGTYRGVHRYHRVRVIEQCERQQTRRDLYLVVAFDTDERELHLDDISDTKPSRNELLVNEASDSQR